VRGLGNTVDLPPLPKGVVRKGALKVFESRPLAERSVTGRPCLWASLFVDDLVYGWPCAWTTLCTAHDPSGRWRYRPRRPLLQPELERCQGARPRLGVSVVTCFRRESNRTVPGRWRVFHPACALGRLISGHHTAPMQGAGDLIALSALGTECLEVDLIGWNTGCFQT